MKMCGIFSILKSRRVLSAVFLAIAIGAAPSVAQDLPAPFCKVLIHDELGDLEDARIAVELAKSNYAAYLRIFGMIEALWEARTIPRMDYVKAKYDRDAARLELEKADLILDKQASLVEQYRLLCGRGGSKTGSEERDNATRKEYLRYRRSDCDSLAKAMEVAETNLEYNREYLKKIQELRHENFATHTQVIFAELDVEREEKSLVDAKRRTAACRDAMDVLERSGEASPAERAGSN